MIGVVETSNRWRTRPVYTISQTAKLAGVHPITVRRWLYGSFTASTKMRPVFSKKGTYKEDTAEVSFLQLAEIVVVSRFRQRKVKLDTLRQAHEYACQQLGLDYPFAWLNLKTDGIHVFSDFEKMKHEVCPPECSDCLNVCPIDAIAKTGKVNHHSSCGMRIPIHSSNTCLVTYQQRRSIRLRRYITSLALTTTPATSALSVSKPVHSTIFRAFKCSYVICHWL